VGGHPYPLSAPAAREKANERKRPLDLGAQPLSGGNHGLYRSPRLQARPAQFFATGAALLDEPPHLQQRAPTQFSAVVGLLQASLDRGAVGGRNLNRCRDRNVAALNGRDEPLAPLRSGSSGSVITMGETRTFIPPATLRVCLGHSP
jgi:hypothetical protein